MSFPNTVLRLGGGRGDSVQFRPVCWRGFFQALLAQLAEQLTLNQRVASSSLAQGIGSHPFGGQQNRKTGKWTCAWGRVARDHGSAPDPNRL